MRNYALILALLSVVFCSCSLENESRDFYLEVVPIESVVVPESFIFGETHEIEVSYERPSTCHEFNDFIYEINGNERTIAVVNTVYSDIECSSDDELITVSFDFTVAFTETYLFKFYQGEDEDGDDQFLLVEVPVVSGRMSTE